MVEQIKNGLEEQTVNDLEEQTVMGLEERIRKVLQEQVDPVLSEHFGGAQLTRIDGRVAYVKLTGACASCPSAQDTLENVVKDFVMGGVPELEDVVLDTSVSEELLDMAKKILSQEN